MTQGWTPPPDPGYRVDGALPPGFDVGALLGQLYGGQRLTRGMAIPLGAATVTITAESFDVPRAAPPPVAPPAAYPAAAAPAPAPPMAPPPGMTDPMQIAMWVKDLRASGQLAPGTVVQIGGSGGMPATVVLGGGTDARADIRARLLAAMASGGVVAQTSSASALTEPGGFFDIMSRIDGMLGRIPADRVQRFGGVGRFLAGSTGGGAHTIRQRDPGFLEQAVVAEATASLRALAAARAEGRPELVRRHLSGLVYDREARQMQIDGLQRTRRVVEGLEVRSATIDECGAASIGDYATIRFRLYGADRDVDAGGKRIAGDKKPADWHELWFMARPMGAMTPPPGTPGPPCSACGFAGADPAAGLCPGCGQPLPPAPGQWVAAGFMRLEPRHK
jgi:predicted lipid-binding transport protein (Tim44 family)